jgi:quinolinate synthase
MNNINKDIVNKIGFVNIPVKEGIDLVKEINTLRKEKNAIILAHYYQVGEIQDIADFVGDSLDLSRKAADNNADMIVFAGVHFMAETAKILSPMKKVVMPDNKAGCSLADSCDPVEFKKFIDQYPDHTVISYINTTAEIKKITDIVCTSTNAVSIVKSLPEKEKIIFAPDKNLGNYIKSITNRKNMLIWDGACHVHEEFSLEKIMELKKEHTEAKVIAHPECKQPVLQISDHIGSTASLLKFVEKDKAKVYIVATESGIIHQMKKIHSKKLFIPAPPIDSTCGCNDCNYMKLNTLEKIYNCLKYEVPEVELDEETIIKAKKPIERMLELSKNIN